MFIEFYHFISLSLSLFLSHRMQVFMIDERSHSGLMAMRAGGGGGVSLGGRMGDSMPDYDNVKVSFVMQMHEKLTFPPSSLLLLLVWWVCVELATRVANQKWSTIVFVIAPAITPGALVCQKDREGVTA